MYKDNINQITVITVIDKRIKRKNGIYPVKVQVVYRRLQKYYLTGKSLSEEDWKKLPNARSAELTKIRNSIKSSYDLVYKNVEELSQKGEFSFDSLSIRLGKASGGTLNVSHQMKIETLKNEGRVGNMYYYMGVLSCVERIFGKNIPVENVAVSWLKKLETRLLEKNVAYSSIGMHMRGIHAIMNQLKRDGIIKESQYPFGKDKYEIKTGESRKKALTLEQLAAIANYDDGNELTSKYRDLWLFVYLCNGINIADLVNLKYNQIVDGEIFYIREKTKRNSNCYNRRNARNHK